MSTLTIRTVTTPDEPDEPIVSQVFSFGGAELWLTATDGTAFVEGTDVAQWTPGNMHGLAQLRDLAQLLAHPTVRALLNV